MVKNDDLLQVVEETAGTHSRHQLINDQSTHFLPRPTQVELFDFDLEQDTSALAAYEQAIILAPREAALYYHKAQILEHMGRSAEAQSAYQAARTLGFIEKGQLL